MAKVITETAFSAFNVIDNGIILVDRNMNLLFMNRWIKKRLPTELKNTVLLTDILSEQNNSMIRTKIKLAFEFSRPVVLASVFHQFVLPLTDSKFSDGLMRQQGVFSPIWVLLENNDKPELCVMLQVLNVSNMMIQVTELESEMRKRKLEEQKRIIYQNEIEKKMWNLKKH